MSRGHPEDGYDLVLWRSGALSGSRRWPVQVDGPRVGRFCGEDDVVPEFLRQRTGEKDLQDIST